jgi:hypothetical protein
MSRDVLRGAFIDQEARDMANRAIGLIETHERVCSERAKEAATWRSGATHTLNEIKTSLNEKLAETGSDISGIEAAIGSVYSRLWLAAVGLVALLLAVIGYLIAHKGL